MKQPFPSRFQQISRKISPNPNLENIMTYAERLNPWCIIRPVSHVQMRIVARFRRRVDAEGHLRVLKRLMPDVPFEIMFDVPPATELAEIEDSRQN